MSLVRMAFANYRCFRARQDIELRPLTVVLGRNNSGKSALVRAPLILSAGIHTNSPAPLDLDRLDEDMLESFTDLLYGNRSHGSLDLELEVASAVGPISLAATVQNIHEYRTQVVSSLTLRTDSQQFQFTWEQQEPPTNGNRYTLETYNNDSVLTPIDFHGLLPAVNVQLVAEEVAEELARNIGGIRAIVDAVFPMIRYFGPFRDRPRRRYKLPAHMPAGIGTTGENAAGILASDLVRHRGQLIEQVNETMAEHLPGWQVAVVEQAGTYAVLLSSHADDSLRVNLADTGTGVAQVLPVFVQRAKDALEPPGRQTLEIIEQPELHLHPAAHGPLAQLYAHAVMTSSRVGFLIETHSETFLLRLRRLVAEGRLDPDLLAVYFVEHSDGAATARRINVDADGNVDYWPAGVFSEDYEETRALARAQLAKENADAG